MDGLAGSGRGLRPADPPSCAGTGRAATQGRGLRDRRRQETRIRHPYARGRSDAAAAGLGARRGLEIWDEGAGHDGVRRTRYRHGEPRFPTVHRGAVSGCGPGHQGGDPLPSRQRLGVQVPDRPDRDQRVVVGRPPGGAGRCHQRAYGRWKGRSATIRISHPTCRPSCPITAPRT